jgi:hypothetical protein
MCLQLGMGLCIETLGYEWVRHKFCILLPNPHLDLFHISLLR